MKETKEWKEIEGRTGTWKPKLYVPAEVTEHLELEGGDRHRWVLRTEGEEKVACLKKVVEENKRK